MIQNLRCDTRSVIRRERCDKKSHNKLLVVSYPIHLG